MNFEFATATRVIFGRGTARRTGELAAPFGRRALLVTGRDANRAAVITAELRGAGVSISRFAVSHEPDTDTIERGAAQARDDGCDFVVGIGGGSVLDTAKAVAAILPQPGRLLDYLEVVGRGVALSAPPLPCVAIPTTAGTGSEVTRNAVLTVPERRLKVSLRGPQLFPRLAIVDPELTRDLPPHLTAFTGLDALTQLVEPYLSSRANPLVDAICCAGMSRAAGALRTAVEDPAKQEAREQMALASLLSGIALTNAGLGAVHGFAGVIGGMFDVPHGAICAALLPHVVAGNWKAMQARGASADVLHRFDEVARRLTTDSSATANAGIEWLRRLAMDLEIPTLATHGVTTTDVDTIVERAATASSMKANPVALTAEEMREMLTAAI